jgi:hypothetical protein
MTSCKDCGSYLPWPQPVGVVYSTGEAACLPCHDAACEAEPGVPLPTTVANCVACKQVRGLDADRLCQGCLAAAVEMAA